MGCQRKATKSPIGQTVRNGLRTRGLAARQHKNIRMTVHLLQAQLLAALGCQDHAPDIGLLPGAPLEAPVDAVGRVLEVVVLQVLDEPRLERLEQRVEPGVVLDELGHGDDLDGVEDDLDPARVLQVAEQAERLPEGQVAHEVEGGELVHLHHVDGPVFTDGLAQLGYQQVNMLAQNGLVALQGALREGGREELAKAPMVLMDRGAVDAVDACPDA